MTKLRIQNVRVTFPAFFEPKVVNGQGEPKYSGAFLFPKDHPQIGAIRAALEEAGTDKWGAKAKGVMSGLKASDKLAVHDGDSKSEYEGYAGNLFINASNKIRPLVVDADRSPLAAGDGKPYSGCYVNVMLEFWAQDNNFGKRVNASLLGVQFAKDGDRLAGGGVAAATDFEDVYAALDNGDGTGKGAADLF